MEKTGWLLRASLWRLLRSIIFQRGGNAVHAACAMVAATCTMWDVLSRGGETQALIRWDRLPRQSIFCPEIKQRKMCGTSWKNYDIPSALVHVPAVRSMLFILTGNMVLYGVAVQITGKIMG